MRTKLLLALCTALALAVGTHIVLAQSGPNTKAHPNSPTDNWQHDMLWSWNDTGFCEGVIQKRVQALDAKYKTRMWDVCIKPGGGGTGRACLMRNFACDAAKHKFDQKAWEITMATQAHIDWREGRLREVGETGVASFLRTYFKCQ
jgi:hypothetical protein